MSTKYEIRPAGPANPFEAFLLAVIALQGFLVLAGLSKPASIVSLLPNTFRIIWALLMLVGGVTSLAGLYWPGTPFTGCEVKRVGLIASGFGALAYGVALLSLGSSAWVAASTSFFFASACVVRHWQVGRALRQARYRIVRIVDGETIQIAPALPLTPEPTLVVEDERRDDDGG